MSKHEKLFKSFLDEVSEKNNVTVVRYTQGKPNGYVLFGMNCITNEAQLKMAESIALLSLCQTAKTIMKYLKHHLQPHIFSLERQTYEDPYAPHAFMEEDDEFESIKKWVDYMNTHEDFKKKNLDEYAFFDMVVHVNEVDLENVSIPLIEGIRDELRKEFSVSV